MRSTYVGRHTTLRGLCLLVKALFIIRVVANDAMGLGFNLLEQLSIIIGNMVVTSI